MTRESWEEDLEDYEEARMGYGEEVRRREVVLTFAVGILTVALVLWLALR